MKQRNEIVQVSPRLKRFEVDRLKVKTKCLMASTAAAIAIREYLAASKTRKAAR